uniref:Uncharacterized protein n=1 Tax=Anguilla anguilla TaxID=7936 RepID=A0A0E9PHS0_ANGAN
MLHHQVEEASRLLPTMAYQTSYFYVITNESHRPFGISLTGVMTQPHQGYPLKP